MAPPILDALGMHDKGPFTDKFHGKLFGVRFDVWGNGAFTTEFTWLKFSLLRKLLVTELV